jgi:hypothetical protein
MAAPKLSLADVEVSPSFFHGHGAGTTSGVVSDTTNKRVRPQATKQQDFRCSQESNWSKKGGLKPFGLFGNAWISQTLQLGEGKLVAFSHSPIQLFVARLHQDFTLYCV